MRVESDAPPQGAIDPNDLHIVPGAVPLAGREAGPENSLELLTRLEHGPLLDPPVGSAPREPRRQRRVRFRGLERSIEEAREAKLLEAAVESEEARLFGSLHEGRGTVRDLLKLDRVGALAGQDDGSQTRRDRELLGRGNTARDRQAPGERDDPPTSTKRTPDELTLERHSSI